MAIETKLLSVAEIRMDGSTQVRKEINQGTVEDYAACMKDGASFPPIFVVHDGQNFWLADGFHRLLGAIEAGLSEILAEVRPGTLRDARLLAISANGDHGLPRSREDKRRAVLLLLEDEEWSKWSVSEIAKQARVTRDLVYAVQKEHPHLVDFDKMSNKRKVRRGEKVFEMATGRIGRGVVDADAQQESAAVHSPVPKEQPLPVIVSVEKAQPEITDVNGNPIDENWAAEFRGYFLSQSFLGFDDDIPSFKMLRRAEEEPVLREFASKLGGNVKLTKPHKSWGKNGKSYTSSPSLVWRSRDRDIVRRICLLLAEARIPASRRKIVEIINQFLELAEGEDEERCNTLLSEYKEVIKGAHA